VLPVIPTGFGAPDPSGLAAAHRFAAWFGGSVFGPFSNPGEALHAAQTQLQPLWLIHAPMPCPAEETAESQVEFSGSGGRVRIRPFVCGGRPRAWPEPLPEPERLAFPHRPIRPCPDCTLPGAADWRIALLLPPALSAPGIWDVLVAEYPNRPNIQEAPYTKGWLRQSAGPSGTLCVSVRPGSRKRYLIVLLREPRAEWMTASVLEIRPN
jgi:hypothetical protein